MSSQNRICCPDKTDCAYIAGEGSANGTGTLADAISLAALAKVSYGWQNLAKLYAYKDVYIYAVDEEENHLLEEREAWKKVHDTGAKVFAACFQTAVNHIGDLLDLAVLNGAFKTAEVENWHAHAKKVFIYANPQAGVENPYIYRQNYGFALWYAGYDGSMNYAYQHSFGHIWNDFDHNEYRDHVFAYPTSNGAIDTVQWEGFREAVDDTRYLTALINKKGKQVARQWLGQQLLKNLDAKSIRRAIVNTQL